MPLKLSLPTVVIFFLLVCGPAEGWYKQVAGPSYYSVGRASGLLSGIRRSQYARRDESAESGETAVSSLPSGWISHNSIFKTVPVCVKDITPNLQSCELSQEIKGSLKCKADIFISLDSSDCAGD